MSFKPLPFRAPKATQRRFPSWDGYRSSSSSHSPNSGATSTSANATSETPGGEAQRALGGSIFEVSGFLGTSRVSLFDVWAFLKVCFLL